MEIICPHCKATNRVPDERLQDNPVCGMCKEPILPPEPIHLTQANFDAILRGDLPVLVDFWAPWCNPCRMMAPFFAEAATQLHGRIILGKLDTEAEQALAARFGIRSIPTLALFHKGQEIARDMGARPAAQIVQWTESHL